MPEEATPQHLIPFRWPADWTDPSLLGLVEGSPINSLLLDGAAGANRPVAAAAQKAGLVVRERTAPAPVALAKVNWNSPGPLAITELVWPRIAATRGGAAQAARLSAFRRRRQLGHGTRVRATAVAAP